MEYIKVEHPDNDPPDSLKKEELDFEKPSIQFAASDKFLIMWGGKVLSHGTFSTENQTIKIKEVLPGGQTREFSFWVTKFTDKDIVFENTTGDKSRVTAVRQ